MVKENNKDPTIILNNTKNERFREKIKKFAPLGNKIKVEKNENFQKAVKKFINDENFEFKHPLIDIHFFFKALAKNNEIFLVDFSSNFQYIFRDQLKIYAKVKGYCKDNGKIDMSLMEKDFYYLDHVIKQNTNDKKFIPYIYKFKTDLPIIYIEHANFIKDSYNNFYIIIIYK